MKTLLLTDAHGRQVSDFIQEQREREGIERVVFLGDYDTPQVVREIRKLDIPKIMIIGNHDYYFAKGGYWYSPMQTLSEEKYMELWDNAQSEKDFLLEALQGNCQNAGVKVSEKIRKRTLTYVHGSLWYKPQEDDLQGNIPYLWGRIRSREDAEKIFPIMQKQHIWVLFKGHDHNHRLFIKDKMGILGGELGTDNWNLKNDKRYIVSIGPWKEGEYAIFDSDKRSISFKPS